MTHQPLVSVIMPLFNGAATVERSLGSVLGQTWGRLEVLVVDDGSGDDGAERVSALFAGDDRLRLIRQANRGAAAARNLAIAQARGELIAPLDADDIWAPAFIERLAGALQAAGDQAVFAFARSRWIDTEDAPLDGEQPAWPASIGFREVLLSNPVGNGSAAVFRTEAVRAAGGYDEAIYARFGCAEDWALMLRLSWRGDIVPVDEVLVSYRISASSTSHRIEEASGGALAAIAMAEREGPRLSPATYWRARSRCLIWLARRARRAGRPGLAARMAASAYLRNPAWFLDPELSSQLWRGVTRPMRERLAFLDDRRAG